MKIGDMVDLKGNNGNTLIASWCIDSEGIAHPFDSEDAENIAFIVRAVNSHNELVTALKDLQIVTTKMLAGGYNLKMAEMHKDIGNAAEAARSALKSAGIE